MQRIRTILVLIAGAICIGVLVLVLAYPLPTKPQSQEVVQKTEMDLRMEAAARVGSIPLSQLPAHIKPPPGVVSIHFDESQGHRQAVIVNRTGKWMGISEIGLHHLLMVEAEFSPGDWRRISYSRSFWCGNSWFDTSYLLNDHFRYEPIRMNSKCVNGERMDCRIRLRSYTSKYGDVAPSEPIPSSVIIAWASDTHFDSIGMGERTTKELWQIARNEPMLEKKTFKEELRFDAVRRLQQKGENLDELIRVVESVTPVVFSQERKTAYLQELRQAKAKSVK